MSARTLRGVSWATEDVQRAIGGVSTDSQRLKAARRIIDAPQMIITAYVRRFIVRSSSIWCTTAPSRKCLGDKAAVVDSAVGFALEISRVIERELLASCASAAWMRRWHQTPCMQYSAQMTESTMA